jgi:hypothetical protein
MQILHLYQTTHLRGHAEDFHGSIKRSEFVAECQERSGLLKFKTSLTMTLSCVFLANVDEYQTEKRLVTTQLQELVCV